MLDSKAQLKIRKMNFQTFAVNFIVYKTNIIPHILSFTNEENNKRGVSPIFLQ